MLLPENKTYSQRDTMDFRYTVSDPSGIDTCTYVLNYGSNVTINSNITIPLIQGQNKLTLYCNDTYGNMGIEGALFVIEAGGGSGSDPPSKTCGLCPEPSQWSQCSDNTQTRTYYECGSSTGWNCVETLESRDCDSELLEKGDLVFLGIKADKIMISKGDTDVFDILIKNTGDKKLYNVKIEFENIEYKPELLSPTGFVVSLIQGIFVVDIEPEAIDILEPNETGTYKITLFSTQDAIPGTYDVKAIVFSGDENDIVTFPIEVVESTQCCLFGVCYTILFCWYWWIIIIFIIIILLLWRKKKVNKKKAIKKKKTVKKKTVKKKKTK